MKTFVVIILLQGNALGFRSRRLDEGCQYGYEEGFDPLGQPCDDCLAPADWGSCASGEWDDCNGMYQSPIDLVTADAYAPAAGKTQIAYSYAPDSGLEIINTGHNLEVVLSSAAGRVVHNGRDYVALQFHFHLLSEHTVDGEYHDGEMHIVHGAYDDGGSIDSLLVIGIFFNVTGDEDNTFLDTIKWGEAPLTENGGNGTAIDEDVDLNFFADILSGEFWRYKGSLTTPACAEIVEWHVMKKISPMSQSQYDYFQGIFPNPSNYRPVQPMNGRNLLDSAVVLGLGEACVVGADLCGNVDDSLDCVDNVCATAVVECHYGYEEGRDPLGETCDDCLAPADWGSCSTGEWDDCNGMYQSPVDLVTSDAYTPAAGKTQIAYSYAPDSGLEIINTGHNLEVVLTSAAGKVVHNGRDYIALQFHFHLLSEHTDGEMHIVHGTYDDEGNIDGLLVLGIFFNVTGDEDNGFLETIKWEEAPTTETEGAGVAIDEDVDLNFFADILSGEFWRYKGSLTTPACAEIVEWHVMKKISPMSQSQYDYFQGIFPNPSNYRPVQPMNGRNLLDSAVVLGLGEACVVGADLCGNVDDSLDCVDYVCATAVVECHYGYEEGRDPLGETCDDCLAPADWGSCSTGEWNDCDGNYQSPVDLVTASAFTPLAGKTQITFSYSPDSGREIINTGHNLEVVLSSAAGKVVHNSRDYMALQFHFHLLSEHTVDGEYHDGEMHIVHAAYDDEGGIDSLLVLGIFFNVTGDEDNSFLETIKWEEAPTTETESAGVAIDEDVDLNFFADILSGEFWRYKGSLTTPPCSEIVEWHVMKTVSPMSQSQYDYFQNIFPNPSNYRPVQPMNDRNLLDSAVVLSASETCVKGADLCGDGLECSESVCVEVELATDSTRSSSKNSSTVSKSKFRTAIIVSVLVVFFGTMFIMLALFICYLKGLSTKSPQSFKVVEQKMVDDDHENADDDPVRLSA
ncbi:hypothetical protein CTAYLR_001326 [Chrysophaeum taylorii]|uniref:Carbonic anhydrase n=1 Tax=Chrysophaeum taylorii TaxID=2483200 RepID=A0AAD7XJK4_9STRA|nr:hypothetical protein CTAYLR_001326 [Chrysophaeum taylorii]